IAVERPHRSLSVHHGTGRGRIHPRIARASVSSRGGEADVSPRIADRASVPAGSPFTLATASGASRALRRNVSDTAPLVGDGHVRLRLPLVFDGGPVAGNLARLPSRYRSQGSGVAWNLAIYLSGPDARVKHHQRAFAEN